jgi:predicted MPP superfamily phosphohydrolase
VIGDTRPTFESDNFRNFEELAGKINELKPAFVVNLGDLIYGYAPRSKEKQWDKYQEVVKEISEPYYQVPGNHDTHSKEARKIYVRRFGKCYQSFDYGGWHFVLLDNTEAERWGYLGPEQLA